MLLTKFQVNWPFSSEEEAKNRFSKWRPLQPSLISDRNDFSYFLSTSLWCLLPSLKSIYFSVQEKKLKIDFKDGGHGIHLGFQIGTILPILKYVTPMLRTKFKVNWLFGSGEARKKDFQDVGHGGHLGFPIGTILAIVDLQVTPMLPIKLQI